MGLRSELEEFHIRIERTKAEAIENFNEQLNTVLDYENSERIWLECTEQTVREDRQTVDKNVFELAWSGPRTPALCMGTIT